jgi:hypothetical protein
MVSVVVSIMTQARNDPSPAIVAFAMRIGLSRRSTALPWQPLTNPALPS